MPDWFITLLPILLHAPAVAGAGIIALIGLLLWSAGIKAIRPVSASVMGGAMAGIAWAILPNLTGLSPEISAMSGLIIGVIVGIAAIRFLQGAALALTFGIAASAGYYHWQAPRWNTAAIQTSVQSPAAHAAVPRRPLSFALPALPANAPTSMLLIQAQAEKYFTQWNNIPAGLRQSMLVIGGGLAVLVFLLSLQTPKYTAWLVTASAGTGLLIVGSLTLVQVHSPRFLLLIPASLITRLGIVAAIMTLGLLLQWKFFWPVKPKVERPKDRSAETVPAF